MDMENMSGKRKAFTVTLLSLPLLLSIAALVYLNMSWSIFDAETGERFSPVENRPLLAGLIIFTVGYIFFLGLLFSENIVQLFDKRFHMRR